MIELVVLVAAVVLLAVVLRRPLERWNDRVFLEQMEALSRRRPDRDYGLELYACRPSAHAIITGITS